MSAESEKTASDPPEPIVCAHIYPFRKLFLKITQEQFRELIGVESRTSVTNWENSPDPKKPLPPPTQRAVWREMENRNYNPWEELHMPYSDFTDNVGPAISGKYKPVVKKFDKLINEADADGKYIENFIDRIGLYQINFPDAKTGLVAASTEVSYSNPADKSTAQPLDDAKLCQVIDHILQRDNETYSDSEIYKEVSQLGIHYIKRRLDHTDFGLVIVSSSASADEKGPSTFYAHFLANQIAIGRAIRETLYEQGIVERPKAT